MDRMNDYLPEFNNCLQQEKPFCQSKCPWDIDILSFIEKVRRGSFNAAYKILQNSVGFPQIAAAICSENCSEACPLVNSINLHEIEKSVIENATRKKPTKYSLPPKKEKIAVIGAGISGLSCAMNLSEKKYNVTVFEKEDRIGGSLWDIMEADVFMSDFENYELEQSINILTNNEVVSAEQLADFDAVYVATGSNGNDLGIFEKSDGASYAIIGSTVFFAGGSLLILSKDKSAAYGLHMGRNIDNYFKIGKPEVKERSTETKLVLDPTRLEHETDGDNASKESTARESKDRAVEEANRCIMCQCDACRIHCDLLTYLNKWPIRIRDEIFATTLPGKSEVKRTPARRTISMCTQCGLCKETCPENVDLDNYIFEARKRMHELDKTPWVFHDFWLRDMEFSSNDAMLCHSAKSGKNKYAFFPGCQFGALSPDTVAATYEYLLEHEEDTGLLIACCGVPAEWAGNTEAVEENRNMLLKAWNELGKPKLVLACPTCATELKRCLPEIETVFIYELIESWGGLAKQDDDRCWSVFDPCASSGNEKLRDNVRNIAAGMGIKLEPLPRQEEYTACCSFGGHGEIADPEFSKFVVDKRINESDRPYLTYCINCRDNFSSAGKESVHILEKLFNIEPESYTVTEMRQNRLSLKNHMLNRFWGENSEAEENTERSVFFSDELSKKLSDEKILEEDMESVVLFCEKTGRKSFNTQTGCYIGYRRIGRMTYWVEYKPVQDSGESKFELINGYQHRMQIEMESIWNGKKVEQLD
ncbi:MAG: FAD-dependent oxidoreductase [Bacillota bacterium]|nr:FAD-dependent oxidoreductase [Bacillota bacterium]